MFPFKTSLFYALVLCSSFMVTAQNDPYLTSTTLFNLNYQKMLHNFKVFAYRRAQQFNFRTEAESLFYYSLLNSPYITQQAEQAHLFFLPFSVDTPTRSLSRLITSIRNDFPYWNRTLGADHFYLSCDGVPHETHRNLVEMKKNAVQISCFPTRRDRFVPHKDIMLPPHALGTLLDGREFCVLEYENTDKNENDVLLGEALRLGCLLVVVLTEGHVNDMPFMDVLRWREMAVFVKSVNKGFGGVLSDNDTWRERHVHMRELGVAASKHLRWNKPALPFDAFNTLMYQLWLRRHTVRYASIQ